MTEMWSTVEQIAAKLTEFESALGPRWERPFAWVVMHEDGDGRIVVDRAEAGEQRHLLAMAVLATVVGYGYGSSVTVTRIDAATLDRAIATLAPAEACTAYQHPNLRAWRQLREVIGEGGSAVVVFTQDIDIADPQDPHAAALLGEIHRGNQGNDPYRISE
jgi:hypothetical protein